MNKQKGMSLSEVLIGLFLASIISTVLLQTYLLTKRHYTVIQDALEVNFEVQWVRDLLSDSIRRAGFTPCLSSDLLALNSKKSIYFETIPRPTLYINRMSKQFGELIAIPNKNQIIVSAELSVRKNQNILIANCFVGELHQITEVKKVPQGVLLTLKEPLVAHYSSLTYVGEWLQEQWFIKTNSKGERALYYQQTHSEELTSVINALNIKSTRIKGKNITEVELGLSNTKSHYFKVLVRA